MPATVVFDNASLADAVNKASRIAPRKGAAFDKAAGILLNVNPAERTAKVRATDLEITYDHNVTLLDGKGDPTRWRIPASILAGIMSNLPMGDGAATTFIDREDGSWIRLKCGNMVARLDTLDAMSFPRTPEFDVEGMTPAQELSSKIEQVTWAVDPKSPILSGIHLDGERLVGCDRHSLAMVPCVIAIDKPVTVPLAAISQIVKSASDIRIRAVGKQFQMTLDSETKVSTPVLEGQYPNVMAIAREDFSGSAEINRSQFVDTLNRIMVITQNEQSSTLSLEFNAEGLIRTLTFGMEITKTGRIQDSIDLQGEGFEGIFKILYQPKMLLDAVSQVKSDMFTFSFGHADEKKADKLPCRITTESGYSCYVMPKAKG